MKKIQLVVVTLTVLLFASAALARGTVSGNVVDREGNLLTGIEVILSPVADESLRTYRLKTNKKGVYTFMPDNGEYIVTVSDETWELDKMKIFAINQNRETIFEWAGRISPGQDPIVLRVSSGDRITTDLALADKAVLKRESGMILLAMVVQALESGDQEKAASTVRELLAESPDDAIGLTLEAYLLAEKGDLAAAEASLNHALEVDPDLPDAQFQLGAIYLDTDRRDEAHGMFAKVTAGSGPDDLKARAWVQLGEIQRNAGEVEPAIQSFSTAAEMSPELSQVLAAEIASLYTRVGQEDQAEAWLAKSGAEASGDPAILYNIAVARFNEKEWEPAAEGFRKVIAADADFADAYRNLGYCLLNLDSRPEAAANLKQYLELVPDASDAAQIEGLVKALEQ